jgi:protein tyrosine phosphatase
MTSSDIFITAAKTNKQTNKTPQTARIKKKKLINILLGLLKKRIICVQNFPQ